jgi:signal transduction histidine kinase
MSSIRVRLTLWYVAILAVVLLVFSSIIYDSQARSLRSEMESRLRKEGQRLAGLYDPGTGTERIDMADKPIPTQGPSNIVRKNLLPGNEVLLLLDSKGNVTQVLGQIGKADISQVLVSNSLAQLGAQNKDEAANILQKIKGSTEPLNSSDGSINPLGDAATGTMHTGELTFETALTDSSAIPTGANPNYLFYSTSIMSKNQQVGTLIVGAPRDDEQQLQSLLVTLLLAIPATLLLSAAGGYWLAARAMRPVRLITRAANEIGASELGRRLNLRSSDELGELALTFDRMLDRLEAAFKRQRQFTTDAGHELRTPLTIVGLEVERGLDGRRTPEEYRRALAIIEAENEQMSHLVNDLLVLARADSEQALVRHEEVDPSDLALAVVERMGPLARARGIELSTGELPELKVIGDRLYLGRMLTNLVENAIKYSSGSKKQVRVCVETGGTNEEEAWVRVSDNGPGIAAEHLPFLFDRFYRVDKARTAAQDGSCDEVEVGGSGLGLSIVQWVAQAHGGQVLVESEPGIGSTFEVRLPLASGAGDQAESTEGQELVGVRD